MGRFVVAMVVLYSAVAQAQAPLKLGYQGRLLKADGTPETGVVSVGFSLFNSASGGNSLWTETQSLALADGFYATALGEASALPAGAFTGELFLEISTAGVALTPRHKLTSVPFALTANDARNVSGGVVDAASIKVNGKSILDSGGKLDTAQLKACAAAGEILKWDGSAWGCAADAGGMTSVAASKPLSGEGTTSSPLALSACAEGQILKYGAGGWACAADAGGMTAVSVAKPLVGDGTPGAPVSFPACSYGQILKYGLAGWACGADENAGGTVTSVTAEAPLASTGGATPKLTLAKATASADGYLAAADFKRFDRKLDAPAGRNLIAWLPDVSRWANERGSQATVALDPDSLEGATSFKITVPLGSAGGGNLVYGDVIPVDPSRRYRGRVSAKMAQGAGTFYAGYIAYDAAGKELSGNGGTWGYFIANGVTLPSTWTTLTGTISGTGTNLNQFPASTRFIKPLIIANYNNAGITYVESFEIHEDDVPSTQVMQAWLTNAGDFTAPSTDVILKMKFTNEIVNTAPSIIQVRSDGVVVITRPGLVWMTATADVIPAAGASYGWFRFLHNGSVAHHFLSPEIGRWTQLNGSIVRKVNSGDTFAVEMNPANVQSMDNSGWSSLTITWQGLD